MEAPWSSRRPPTTIRIAIDGDEGPGTGGMGSLSLATDTLPFMTPDHYAQACSIIERVIERLASWAGISTAS